MCVYQPRSWCGALRISTVHCGKVHTQCFCAHAPFVYDALGVFYPLEPRQWGPLHHRALRISNLISLDSKFTAWRLIYEINFTRSAVGPDSSHAVSSNRNLQHTQAEVEEVQYLNNTLLVLSND